MIRGAGLFYKHGTPLGFLGQGFAIAGLMKAGRDAGAPSGLSAQSRSDKWFDQTPDSGSELFDRAGGINLAHALRLSGSNCLIAFCDALEEIPVRLFDSIADEGQGGLAGR